MGEVFEKFKPCCTYEPPSNFHDGYSGFELVNEMINKYNEFVDYVNTIQGQIDDKEDSDNITNNRKLSENGCFTGSLGSECEPVETTLGHIETNSDQIQYLTEQFDDGQTGLVIDGGWFGDDDILKNYDGGSWD